MNIQNPITVKQAILLLEQHGMVCGYNAKWGFRINYKHSGESTAYYTDDLEDAVAVGITMAQKRDCRTVGRRNKAVEHGAWA